MKKLFISQPMRGKSDEDILAERKKAIELAQEMIGEPVEVIDSFFQEAPADAKPLWFLGKSLELLSGADVAYFAQGWEDARGCVIEHDSALAYGIKSIVSLFRKRWRDRYLRPVQFHLHGIQEKRKDTGDFI